MTSTTDTALNQFIFFNIYEGSKLIDRLTFPYDPSEPQSVQVKESQWQVETKTLPGEAGSEATIQINTFTCVSGTLKNAAVGIGFTDTEWSQDHFLLMPGAVYAGNRHKTSLQKYSPYRPEADVTRTPTSSLPTFRASTSAKAPPRSIFAAATFPYRWSPPWIGMRIDSVTSRDSQHDELSRTRNHRRRRRSRQAKQTHRRSLPRFPCRRSGCQ